MNKIYRLVFNHELGVMQVASELARPHGGALHADGNRRRSRLAASVLAACLSFGVVSSAWAQVADNTFDDDYVMSPDTAANYNWSLIRTDGMYIGYEDNGHVIVRDGLLVESSGFTLGYNEGVTGQLDVIGPNTTLTGGTFGDTSYVGLAGTGVFNVLQGGKAIFTDALEGALRIGWDATGVGTVNVDGEGSEVRARLTQVGHEGDGTLNIINGGKLHVGNFNNDGIAMTAGDREGASGAILVSGAGSLLDVFSSALLVGDGGEGTLTISGGGVVRTVADGLRSGVRVGAEATGEGSIDITGAGSTLSASSLVVGASGSGQIAVREGARVESSREEPIDLWLSVGHDSTATGNMLIEGAGTTLDAKGSGVYIGYEGRGELTVRNGANASLGNIAVGGGEDGNGSILVTGAGTRLSTGDAHRVYVGDEGNGDLQVLDGAEVAVGNLVIGASPTDDDDDQDPRGSVLISGNGSALKTAGELIIADDTAGTLHVENGASMEAGSVRMERDEDDNPSLVAGELRITGAGTTFKSGKFDASTHFSLTDGAQLDTSGASVRRSYATGRDDTALVSGTDTRWTNTGELGVNTALDITDGAKVSTGTLLLGDSGSNPWTSEILFSQLRILGEGSSLTTTGDVTLGTGYTTVEPGYLVLADGGHLQVGGDIRLDGAGLVFGAMLAYDQAGAPVIADPQAPGSVNADARFVFTESAGADNLVFNHTSDNLVLSNPMLSEGYAAGIRSVGGITSLAGTTRLTGDLSQFASRIDVTGGKLVIDADVNVRPENYDLDTDQRGLQAVDVSGGTLVVNRGFGFEMSSSANNTSYGGTSDFSVHTQGTLGGAGRIFGTVEAFDGGHVAPGDGTAATLAIEGDLTFGKSGEEDTTAFFDVDIHGDGTSDKLAVSGTAQLDQSGVATTVNVTALDPGTSYQDGQQYTILTANGGVDGTFDKVLSNSAFLTPTLTYDAHNVFLGISLDTSKAAAIVEDGEVLDGSGAWASIDVLGGGTVSPGGGDAPLGTISATGPVKFGAGSFYDVDIQGDGGSDRLTTTGPATLEGGTVRVTALDPQTSYQDGQQYTILSADGGLSGEFDEVMSRSAFIDPSLSHEGNAVRLTIALKSGGGDNGGGPTPPPIFETVATTRNQYNIARALDTLPQSGDGLALYNTLLMLSAEEARDAYGSLSGELHLATRSALLDDGFLRKGIDTRLAGETIDQAGDGITAWVAGDATSGGIHGDGNAAPMDYGRDGVMAGADWALSDTLVLGAALGTADHEVRVPAWNSSADVDARYLGIYAQARWDALSVRGGISHAWYDVDGNRQVAVGTSHLDGLDAGYDASATSMFAEGAWDFAFGRTLLTPYLAVAHTRLETDGATEHGGITALDIASSKDELLSGTAGIRASWALAGEREDNVRLQAGLAWQNNSGELKPDQSARLNAGGDGFVAYGTPLARNLVIADVSLQLQPTANSHVSLGVQGRFGDGQSDGGAQLQWGWRF